MKTDSLIPRIECDLRMDYGLECYLDRTGERVNTNSVCFVASWCYQKSPVTIEKKEAI